MFGQIGNIASMIKRAREFAGRMDEFKDKLRSAKVTGKAGGDLIQIEMTGLRDVLSCKIDPKVFHLADLEMLEDLIVMATSDALGKADELHRGMLEKSAEALDLPGVAEALSKIGAASD